MSERPVLAGGLVPALAVASLTAGAAPPAGRLPTVPPASGREREDALARAMVWLDETAVLLNDWDTRADNQRLVCLDEPPPADGRCRRPLAYLQDVGATFGRVGEPKAAAGPAAAAAHREAYPRHLRRGAVRGERGGRRRWRRRRRVGPGLPGQGPADHGEEAMPDALKRERGSRQWMRRPWRGRGATIAIALLLAASLGTTWLWAAPPALPGADETPPTHRPEEASLREAIVALPIAAALGAVLAFRPQRRGTPPRHPAVVQTQITLSVVGALVMLVVGASIARAFGIVGAAGLVRYRSKIEDPKDAVVMLACLAIGLASGVGIYLVALVSTVFVLALVWVLESKEPEVHKGFLLAVKGKGSGQLQTAVEKLLRKNGIKYELRTASQDELTYSVRLPLSKKTGRITGAILALGDRGEMAVDWSEKKPAKAAA